MKRLLPDISTDLITTDDLKRLFQKDETLSGYFIQDGNGAELSLKSVILNDSKLQQCDLASTRITKLQLQDCLLQHCDLTASIFADSSWHAIEVTNSRCSGIQLQNCLMKNVLFKDCKLDLANFRFARLENVAFEHCVIKGLDFYNALLKNVVFEDCVIEDVEFSEATLKQVDLSGSTIASLRGLQGLRGAMISHEQLVRLAPYMGQEIGLVLKDQDG